jgi:hypothetical protein
VAVKVVAEPRVATVVLVVVTGITILELLDKQHRQVMVEGQVTVPMVLVVAEDLLTAGVVEAALVVYKQAVHTLAQPTQ